MKKLSLQIDALAVTSFRTAAAPYAVTGTVQAHEVTAAGQFTCGATCQGATCQTSCGGGGHCTCYPG